LDHPNIASLFESYQDPKKIYIVTELCSGGQLKNFMHRNQGFSEFDAAKIMN